jgi:predicted nucleotidyltransferase
MDGLEQLELPGPTREALRELREKLKTAAGDNLVALIVFGGVARGRFRQGLSDINLLVLLKQAQAVDLSMLAAPLKAAWRAIRVEPLIVTLSELNAVAATFATKFVDIRKHHVMLLGDADPLQRLQIDPRQIRARARQEMRNLSLRLRRRLVAAANDPVALRKALLSIAAPLSANLSALLEAVQSPDDAGATMFERAAAAFDLNAPALKNLARLRKGEQVEDLARLADALLGILMRLADLPDATT